MNNQLETTKNQTINIPFVISCGLLSVTLLSALILTSSYGSAETKNATVTVSSACTMTTTGTGSYSATINNNTYDEIVGSPLNVECNDASGYSIYAIGYSNDSYTNNNTKMIASTGAENNIPTATSGNASWWAMKVAGSGTNTPTIDNSFSSYQQIPATYTKISHVLNNTTNSITTPTYKVNISGTQAAGTYTGKVKYSVVHPNNANPPEGAPVFTWQESTATRPADADVKFVMQDFDTDICNLGTNGQIGWVKDSRDDTVYTIGKLADGKCWMLENLDIAGGTALSADDTDVTSVYIDSFSTSNNLTKTGDTIVLPASSTSGFDTDNYSYVYNSGNKTSNCASPGCYSYYSWDAATLGSGRTLATENTDAPQSICPKGWRLPTSGGVSNNEWKRGDFYALASAYGANLESEYSESFATFYNNAGPGTTPNFLLTGRYDYGWLFDGGDHGEYWSSTSYSNTYYAHSLGFYSSNVSSAGGNSRSYGLSIRCLLRD